MQINLRYFASIREALGRPDEVVSTNAVTIGQLRDELIAQGGARAEVLGRGRPIRIAFDQVMCDEAAELKAGSEVAFFPPVTGG